MAMIGLRHVVAAPQKEAGQTVTYDKGFVVGRAMKADIKINTSDAKLYGDDVVSESDRSFTDGTVDVGVTQMTEDIQSKLLGHSVSEEGGEIIANSDDVAPYVGLGFYAPKLENNVKKYRAIWFTKVNFGEPSESLATREGSTAFVTPSMTGSIMADAAGNWKKEQTFLNEAEAKAYLDKLAGLTTPEQGT